MDSFGQLFLKLFSKIPDNNKYINFLKRNYFLTKDFKILLKREETWKLSFKDKNKKRKVTKKNQTPSFKETCRILI